MPTGEKPSQKLDLDQLKGLYRQMVLMRRFEEALTQLSTDGQLRGSLHLAEGQEALPAGACLAMDRRDAITVTYRGHGYILAKGSDLKRVMAEILGREDGFCRGRGGKMHIFDLENGVLGSNGIVGGGVPSALGAAFASWVQGDGAAAATVFGDGAINQGAVHESLNLAGLWSLPIVFLCENNLYAEMTPLSRSSAEREIYKRAEAYGMPGLRIDGNDVLEVYDTVHEAMERARSGHGPTLIEAMTYRTCGHYQLDPGLSYRTRAEVDAWRAKSPILRFADVLRSHKVKDDELVALEDEAAMAVREAVEFALQSPQPHGQSTMAEVFV